MTKKIIVGGCSFTFGNELSDDIDGTQMSRKSWAYKLATVTHGEYINKSLPGIGNSAIARRVFNGLAQNPDTDAVLIMWTFLSRYDWAFPRNKHLNESRWASMSPWDTSDGEGEAFQAMEGSETQQEEWKARMESFVKSGAKPFTDALYRHAANQYHEIYLSWKSIIWLQNLLEKKNIKYMFTLADNSLFYQDLTPHFEQDNFIKALHSEIDFTKWYSFGDRMMGFNQWSIINEYQRGTTHPLDKAHIDAVQLMQPTFDKLIGGK